MLERSMGNRMKVYNLELVTMKNGVASVETIGVYSSEATAKQYRKDIIKRFPELFEGAKKSPYELVIYEFVVDDEPVLYNEKLNEETVDVILDDLIKEGLVEVLIGEDGEFYYGLTPKGLEASMKRNYKK